jgi:hypothetical protein
MPTLTNPKKYAMLLLATLLMLYPRTLMADSAILSPEAQAKLEPEYARLAEIEMNDSDAEKQAQAVESIVLIVGDEIAAQTTREVTAVYLPLAKDGKKWRALSPWGPWIATGGVVVVIAAFVGGVLLGAK